MNRTRIEWTDFTWNPVTGCLHDCDYCYARKLTVRFPANFPSGFAPAFHPERLGQPCRVKRSSRVFVCSMADLFGAWVPDDWIGAVFDAVRSCPRHTFQFLTKNPARYASLDLPANAWYGTTVDRASVVGPDRRPARVSAGRPSSRSSRSSRRSTRTSRGSTRSWSAPAPSPCACRRGTGSCGSWRGPARPGPRSS